MAVKLIYNDIPAFLDSSGDPLNGGKLYTYAAGSTTLQTTYTTSAGDVAQANPIVLNSRGEPANAIWGTVGQTYKLVLKTAADATIWTIDNVSPINDSSATNDQWVAGPAPTYIGTTSFSLVGDQTSTFTVGRRVKTTNSGGTIYSRISVSTYTTVTTITVVNDSGTLDSGLSAVSYGLLTSTNISIPRLDATGRAIIGLQQDVLTTLGDTIVATTAGAAARIPATASVAAHATTSDLFTARETLLTGAAVTFTDIADAPFVGAEARVYMNATHTFTDGAVFNVQGNANRTVKVGDWVRINAVTVSTFDVLFDNEDGTAVVGGVSAATQAEMEAASSTTVFASPGRTQYHPGVAKAWVKADAAGAMQANLNMTSVTDDGLGLITGTIAADFSSTGYCIDPGILNGGSRHLACSITAQAAGSFAAMCGEGGGAFYDPANWYFSCFGDQ